MFKNIFSILICLFSFSICFDTLAAKKVIQQEPVKSSLVVDMNTGKVLHAQNARAKVNPASLTKVMTLYLLFESIESGKLSLNHKMYISKNAENMKPCKLGLKAGEQITVRDAIMALIVKSANDVAIVVAENISASEEKFARLMNRKAMQLGMYDTNFTNASGWHNNAQKTTAFDLARLAIAIKRDYPQFYPLFSKTSFNFRGKTIIGHNHVTANYSWSEGLKTGYTKPAGYNLITTASKKNKSIVGVVTGGKSSVARDKYMVDLLDKHLGIVRVKNKKASGVKKMAKNW